MKVGFLGFGNMATALADGFVRAGAVPAGEVLACARDWEKLKKATEPKGYTPMATAAEVAERADVLFAAVKPHQLAELLAPIRGAIGDKPLVSVAVNVPFDRLEALLPGGRHLSTLPNTPVAVGKGVILCESRHSLSPDQWASVRALMETVALVEVVDGAQMGIAGTISGCGPAFAALFIEALADGAVKNGLPRPAAYRLASQMLAGTGALQVETGSHPGAMKDAVCSPGGTTIVGVAALERSGFRSAVIDAVDAIMQKK